MTDLWLDAHLQQGILRTASLGVDNPTRRAMVLTMLEGPALLRLPTRTGIVLMLAEIAGADPGIVLRLVEAACRDLQANAPDMAWEQWIAQPAFELFMAQLRRDSLSDERLRVRLVVLALWGSDNGQIDDSTVALLANVPLLQARAERAILLREIAYHQPAMSLRCADVLRSMRAAQRDRASLGEEVVT